MSQAYKLILMILFLYKVLFMRFLLNLFVGDVFATF